ncbi:hypothetical protein FS842_004466 [Serendipita sp. 407]|nr:hypothetical protein FS842_004466 [Serendipita sp. 407]
MRNTKEICVLFETDEKVDLYSDTIYSIQSEIEAGGNVTCTVKELSIEQQPSLRVVLFLEEQKGTSRNLPNSEMQDNAYATLLSLIEEVTLVLDIPSNWCANGKSQSSIFISCMTVCLDLSAPGRMLARERPKLPSSMDNTCAPTLALSVEPPAPIETGHASQATAKQATEWITINIPKIKLEPVLPSLATTYREAVQLRVQEWYSQRGALLPDDFGNILKKYTQLSSDNKLSVLKDIGQLNGCIQSTAMAVSSFGGTTFNFESTMVKMSNS